MQISMLMQIAIQKVIYIRKVNCRFLILPYNWLFRCVTESDTVLLVVVMLVGKPKLKMVKNPIRIVWAPTKCSILTPCSVGYVCTAEGLLIWRKNISPWLTYLPEFDFPVLFWSKISGVTISMMIFSESPQGLDVSTLKYRLGFPTLNSRTVNYFEQ